MLPNNENYDDELDEELDPDFYIETEPSLTYAMQLTDEENKEDKFKLNAYHSPSPMNELCDYICTWEKKNILWILVKS